MTDDIRKRIEVRRERQVHGGVHSGDAAAMADAYTADATLAPPHSDFVHGTRRSRDSER
jgi:ketosteroid isomerase-like protein